MDAIKHLNNNNALSILAPLGYGVYDFISSFKHDTALHKFKFLRIDCSEALTKAQIESQIKTDTYQTLAQLILICCANAQDEAYFVIFDNIKSSISAEALNYLAGLPDSLPEFGKNIFFIFTSRVGIKQFRKFHVELEALTLHETELILNDRIDLSEYTQSQVTLIHERSEGVVDKLEQIMDLIENSSVDEVLEHDEIFDDEFHIDHIPATTLSQLDLLFTDSSKRLTLKMLNILSILKNGETLTNLKADPMGRDLNPKHVQELVRFELATTTQIDASTKVIKINPIIKDYVLSKMSKEQVYEISNAYLNVTVIPMKNGIKLSSLNRKVYQKGYSTEEDNTGTLLLNSIESCLDSIRINTEQGESNEMNERRLTKLRQYCRAYVYILRSSSRYAETISAVDLLHKTIEKIDPDSLYKYYLHLASSYRIRSNYSEAKKYLDLCIERCPESDKGTLEDIYIERLHLLEHTDMDAAIALAKSSKNKYFKKSVAYLVSEVVLAEDKAPDDRFKSLVRLEKKARRHEHFTLANNILFTINKERTNVDKIKNLDTALESEKSSYNFCRATIYKNQALVESNLFERIKEKDIQDLSYIYSYLFRQKFDTLFVQCHKLLWDIASHRQRGDIITMIYIRGTIVWRLNDDSENEQKYEKLIQDFDDPSLVNRLVYKA